MTEEQGIEWVDCPIDSCSKGSSHHIGPFRSVVFQNPGDVSRLYRFLIFRNQFLGGGGRTENGGNILNKETILLRTDPYSSGHRHSYEIQRDRLTQPLLGSTPSPLHSIAAKRAKPKMHGVLLDDSSRRHTVGAEHWFPCVFMQSITC